MFMSIHQCIKPNSLWYIFKQIPNQRLPIKCSSSTWFYKLAENYDMHIMLRCFNLLENRERLFENILNILDVNE